MKGFYHEEDSGHGHHEPAEFVCEGLEGLWLSGDGVDSLHPGVLGFKLGPQLLLMHRTHSTMYHHHTISVSNQYRCFYYHVELCWQCQINKSYVL